MAKDDKAVFDEDVEHDETAGGENPPVDTEAEGQPEAPPEPTFEEQQAEAAAVQSPGEPQIVPEQRPQAFLGDDVRSDADLRLSNNEPMPQEAFDRANSDEAKEAAIKASRTPRLLEGQRVTFIDGPERGRMGFVTRIEFTDEVQQLLASVGVPEARFAEVAHYVIRTRDGRSDLISATPDQVKPLDDTEGWGRGQI